jgi:hypothetical protein
MGSNAGDRGLIGANSLLAAALLALSAFLSSAADLAAAVCFAQLILPLRGRVDSSKPLSSARYTRQREDK